MFFNVLERLLEPCKRTQINFEKKEHESMTSQSVEYNLIWCHDTIEKKEKRAVEIENLSVRKN